MELFAQLEEHLKADKDYLNKKITELADGNDNQEDLIADIFELSEFIALQKAVKEGSSLDNEISCTLMEYAEKIEEPIRARHLQTIKKIMIKDELKGWSNRVDMVEKGIKQDIQVAP